MDGEPCRCFLQVRSNINPLTPGWAIKHCSGSYNVCEQALREDGLGVLQQELMNHPIKERSETLSKLLHFLLMR
jgi:hypothetical protein